MIAGIFLAAGQSQRFGTQKLLLEIDGKPLVYYSLKNCVDSLLPEVYIVVGAQSEDIEEAVRQFFPDTVKINIIVNEDYEQGMMSSVKKGMTSLDTGYHGAMICLADMPLVTPEIINHLMSMFEEHDKIILPECHGELSHPRIIPARFFPDFLRLEDHEKGKKVLGEYSEETVRVRIGSIDNFVDIDRVDDIESIAEQLKNYAD
jgi:molybdenum cofactor cytidylyltransferase